MGEYICTSANAAVHPLKQTYLFPLVHCPKGVSLVGVYYEKLDRMLKPLVATFHPDLSAHLKEENGGGVPETGPRQAENDSKNL